VKIGVKLVLVVTDSIVNLQIQSINKGAIDGLTSVVKEAVPQSEDERENLCKSVCRFLYLISPKFSIKF
jgi:hypothetical protein